MDQIQFDPMGTVTITIEGKDYKIGRPKLRQYRQFRDLSRELSVKTLERIESLREKLDDPDAEEELADLNINGFLYMSVPWLKAVWEELGDPLPDDHDNWPAWLAADQTIAAKIINHWRTVPLAPGAKGTN